MRRDHLLAGVAALAFAGGPARAASTGAPMTFEELMRGQRTLESARFSPDGQRLLYTIRRNDVPSDGITYPPSSREAWIADLATGRRLRIAEPGSGGGEATPCADWAPDGSGAVFFTDRGGVEKLAFYDVARRRLEVFGPPPSQTCPKWVGRTLVYTAATADAPAGASRRPRLAYARKRWAAAWTTRIPQVSIASSNPVFPPPLDPQPALAFADPATGRSGLLARGIFSTVAPSPDGHRVAVIRSGAVDPLALDRFFGRRGVIEIYRIGPRGGRLLASFPQYDAGSGGLAWSPDGRRLLIGARRPGAGGAGLLVYDMASRALSAAPLPQDAQLAPDRPTSVLSFYQLGWIAGSPAYIAAVPGAAREPGDLRDEYGETQGLALQLFTDRGGRAVPLSDFTSQAVNRFATTPDGDGLIVAEGALWSVSAGRAPRRITSPSLVVTGLGAITPVAEDYTEPAATGGSAAVLLRDASGGSERAIVSLNDGRVRLAAPYRDFAAWSPDLRSLARLHHEGWTSRLETEGAHARPIATFNPEWRDRPLGTVRRIRYRADGRDLTGWVITPPGYIGGRLPAVEWIYGGQVLAAPSVQALPGGAPNPLYEGQLWAAQGYAVIFPSTPIGDGRQTDVPSTLADEAVAAVDAAAASGLVDPDRVGLIGHSFGGFSTAAVLSRRSDRFKAGVAMDGIYDLFGAWGARSPLDQLGSGYASGFAGATRGLIEEGQTGLKAPPWAEPAAYLRMSALYHVDAITTPLMLAVGDLDVGATGLTGSERFYAALQRSGNPTVLLRYWGEGHVQEDPGAIRDEWRRFNAWFAHYLKGPSAVTASATPSANPEDAPANSGPTPPHRPPT